MSGSVAVSLLLAVCILQITYASAIHRTSENNNWFRRIAEDLPRAPLQRRKGQHHAMITISRDTTVDALLYRIDRPSSINGIATLDQELFVIQSGSNKIRVYDTSRPDHPLVRNISVRGLQVPYDMAACENRHSLYISDTNSRIFRVGGDGKITKWETRSWAYGLSVNPASCSVMAAYGAGGSGKGTIQELRDNGRPGRRIAVTGRPLDAVRLSDERYLFAEGWMMEIDGSLEEGRVVLVDGSGQQLQRDSGYTEAGSQPLAYASSLEVSEAGFVLVADPNNHRVVLLDPSLSYIRDLLNRSVDEGVRGPWRMKLDEGRGLLYVAGRSTVRVYSLN